jgi:hypothetical protein
MFIGHYGPALAAKPREPRLRLWQLFLAVQLVDILFFFFVLAGIEKVRIVPGFTATNALDLYHMPYTHSLAGNAAIAALAGIGTWAWARRSAPRAAAARAGWIVAACVLSHWFLDVPFHTPDMPLHPGEGSAKFGFGLWNHLGPTLVLEFACAGIGAWLYWRSTRAASTRARRGGFAFFALLALLCLISPFMPPPPGTTELAVQALASYAGLAALAGWVDRHRRPSR